MDPDMEECDRRVPAARKLDIEADVGEGLTDGSPLAAAQGHALRQTIAQAAFVIARAITYAPRR